ncbi:MAG: glycosyltransferase family 2 protein, partial [Bacillota bacterium]|nr:glycosyltransferase family 2 protein [Bacillota bacterium]
MISVLMPIYNEGEQIYNNVVKVMSILQKHKIDHDFILINDGSSDNTWNELQRLSNDFNNISIISFSRNFGKEPALCAGLDNFNNDACIILDADLQHPPELIPQMVQLWSEQGYDVVEGIKSSRGKETLLSKYTASTFYKLFNKACGIDLNNASDFKL